MATLKKRKAAERQCERAAHKPKMLAVQNIGIFADSIGPGVEKGKALNENEKQLQ